LTPEQDLCASELKFFFYSSAATLDKDKKSNNLESCQGAEVVGSNHPTRSTFIIMVSCGIILSLILTIVGQI
jgi:hypothetical protein